MRLNNTILFGFLTCLVGLYFMNDAWGGFGITLGGYLFPVGTLIVIIGMLRRGSDSEKANRSDSSDDNIF